MANGKQKRRSMGLGSYKTVSLAGAREKATAAATKRTEHADPIKERKMERAKAAVRTALPTFIEAVDLWDADNPHEFGSDGHRQRWLSSLRSLTTLAAIPMHEVTRQDVWGALEPIVARGAVDTANRTRQRIAALWDWADDEYDLAGVNAEDDTEEGKAVHVAMNPATGWAAWKLGKQLKGVKKGHQPSL